MRRVCSSTSNSLFQKIHPSIHRSHRTESPYSINTLNVLQTVFSFFAQKQCRSTLFSCCVCSSYVPVRVGHSPHQVSDLTTLTHRHKLTNILTAVRYDLAYRKTHLDGQFCHSCVTGKKMSLQHSQQIFNAGKNPLPYQHVQTTMRVRLSLLFVLSLDVMFCSSLHLQLARTGPKTPAFTRTGDGTSNGFQGTPKITFMCTFNSGALRTTLFFIFRYRIPQHERTTVFF